MRLKYLNIQMSNQLYCNQSKFQTKRLSQRLFCLKGEEGMANSEDYDQEDQSNLYLHCLPRLTCPKIWDHCNILLMTLHTLYPIKTLEGWKNL